MLPLIFVSGSFLVLTFFLLEYECYPTFLAFLSDEYIFNPDIFQCRDEAVRTLGLNFCENIDSLKLFVNSTLLMLMVSVAFEILNSFEKFIRYYLQIFVLLMKRKGSTKIFRRIIIFQLLLLYPSFIVWQLILSFPLKALRKIMAHIYLLDVREENKFLKNLTNKMVMVTLKSHRVYVGTFIEADLRQESDDDDSLVLCLSLSGYRDTEDGILKYKACYEKYSPEKLIFMREVESISRYREDVAPMFMDQGSVQYPWDIEGDEQENSPERELAEFYYQIGRDLEGFFLNHCEKYNFTKDIEEPFENLKKEHQKNFRSCLKSPFFPIKFKNSFYKTSFHQV